MRKYFVIGNPIDHSLSPILHNYWLKENKIDAMYDKRKIDEQDLKTIISEIKKEKINGINVTVPFKKAVIPYLDKLSPEAEQTHSVNTIVLDNNHLVGYNTDIDGFELSIKKLNYDVSNKKIVILGAGGVVPSIIYALKKMNAQQIYLCNRTKEKAQILKNLFEGIEVITWGSLPNFDMIINATSLGLKENDTFGIDFSIAGKNKLFFDVIYNPFKTDFSEAGSKQGNIIENGLNMFLFQAQKAFSIWHNVEPKIDQEVIKFLEDKN
jgi:shikimate dehydrogenase